MCQYFALCRHRRFSAAVCHPSVFVLGISYADFWQSFCEEGVLERTIMDVMLIARNNIKKGTALRIPFISMISINNMKFYPLSKPTKNNSSVCGFVFRY